MKTQFEKLLELKQEFQKLKQEMTASHVTDTVAAEPLVLPQLEAVADESTKADLHALLAQGHATQAARRRLAANFATNPTLLVRRRRPSTSPRGETTDKPPDEPKKPPKAPVGDPDKTALVYRKIMTEADHKITNLKRAAGVVESRSQPHTTWSGHSAQNCFCDAALSSHVDSPSHTGFGLTRYRPQCHRSHYAWPSIQRITAVASSSRSAKSAPSTTGAQLSRERSLQFVPRARSLMKFSLISSPVLQWTDLRPPSGRHHCPTLARVPGGAHCQEGPRVLCRSQFVSHDHDIVRMHASDATDTDTHTDTHTDTQTQTFLHVGADFH